MNLNCLCTSWKRAVAIRAFKRDNMPQFVASIIAKCIKSVAWVHRDTGITVNHRVAIDTPDDGE